jgi:predicted nucleic acid-binding protein
VCHVPTEDFQDGATYDTVTVTNPFRSPPEELA